ncbi:MAG: hypothetical protein R3Y05_06090 [bacterium]
MCTVLDLHNDSKDLAKTKIQRFVMEMLKNDIYFFEIVHGYNRGTTLKDFLKNKRNLNCNYISKMYPDPLNEGRTMVWLKY